MITIKKRFKVLIIVFLFAFSFIFITTSNKNVSGESKYVVLGGESIGLGLKTSVRITGTYDVYTDNGKYKPWQSSDIKINDEIIKIENYDILDIDSFKEVLNTLKDQKDYIELTLKRDNKIVKTSIQILKNDKGVYSVGLYVKDNVLGVGTLTYLDITKKSFGALGHKAIDSKIVSGEIYNSSIVGLIKGKRGFPGEKKASLNNVSIGQIQKNNEFGIFGTINNIETKNQLIKVASIDEVKKGRATITTVLEGVKKETFEIEIIEVKNQETKDIKGIKFRVIDKDLLEKTGGIIQGMSGSPIVQDNQLVGAVSHVLVEDSAIGYGVFAQWMIEYS